MIDSRFEDKKGATAPREWVDRLPFSPAYSSAARRWSGVQIEDYRREPDNEVDQPPLTHHLLLLHTAPPPTAFLASEGASFHGRLPPGSLSIIPAGASGRWWWKGCGDVLYCLLDTERVVRAAEASDLDPLRIKIDSVFGLQHHRLRDVLLAVRSELTTAGVGDGLLIDSLVNTLIVHLIRHFSAPQEEVDGRLSDAQLIAVVGFIHDNLDGRITLDDLARVAHLSSFHFARLFRNSTGEPPHQYVIKARVERAKTLLRNRRLTLAQVAAAVGFANHAHLTRHFKRQVGATPSSFRLGSS